MGDSGKEQVSGSGESNCEVHNCGLMDTPVMHCDNVVSDNRGSSCESSNPDSEGHSNRVLREMVVAQKETNAELQKATERLALEVQLDEQERL